MLKLYKALLVTNSARCTMPEFLYISAAESDGIQKICRNASACMTCLFMNNAGTQHNGYKAVLCLEDE